MIRTVRFQEPKSKFSTLEAAKNAKCEFTLSLICREFGLALPMTPKDEFEFNQKVDILSKFDHLPPCIPSKYWEFSISFIAAWKSLEYARPGDLALGHKADYHGQIYDLLLPQFPEPVTIVHTGTAPLIDTEIPVKVARFKSQTIISNTSGECYANYWGRIS